MVVAPVGTAVMDVQQPLTVLCAERTPQRLASLTFACHVRVVGFAVFHGHNKVAPSDIRAFD